MSGGGGAVLMAGTPVKGHLTKTASVGSPSVIVDAGTAGGGSVGVNPTELGISASSSGAAPFVGAGGGPYGAIFAAYDGPINAAGGYHVVSISPNSARGTATIAYNTGGAAEDLNLEFLYNGTPLITFSPSGVVIPTLTINVTRQISQLRVVTVAGAVTVSAINDSYIIVNKTIGEATTVTLPAATGLTVGQVIVVKDGRGDAATNFITIAGNTKTIDGAANLIINSNYASAELIWNGAQWNQVG